MEGVSVERKKIVTVLVTAMFLLVGALAAVPVAQGAQDGAHWNANGKSWKTVQTFTLRDMQHDFDYGKVKVWNDNRYLYVQAITNEPYSLAAFYVAVGTSLADIPTDYINKPEPTLWPHEIRTFFSDPNSYTLKIPLTWEKGAVLYIGAHVVAFTPDNADRGWDYPGNHPFPNTTPYWGDEYADYIVYTVTGAGR